MGQPTRADDGAQERYARVVEAAGVAPQDVLTEHAQLVLRRLASLDDDVSEGLVEVFQVMRRAATKPLVDAGHGLVSVIGACTAQNGNRHAWITSSAAVLAAREALQEALAAATERTGRANGDRRRRA